MKDAIKEFDRLALGLDELMCEEDGDLVVPVLTMYLAALGSVSGRDLADFKGYVCSAIDRAFNEMKIRKSTQ